MYNTDLRLAPRGLFGGELVAQQNELRDGHARLLRLLVQPLAQQLHLMLRGERRGRVAARVTHLHLRHTLGQAQRHTRR